MRRLILTIALAAQAAALTAAAEIEQATCTQTAPNHYRIEFTQSGAAQPVQIIASSNPDGSAGKIVSKAANSPLEVEGTGPGERTYFLLKPEHGPSVAVSVRRLPLEGASNVRDLGGYRTADGRMVRWGVLYRANELGHLTPQDLTYLQQLGIKVVCDFRTEQERKRLPDRWPDSPAAEMISNPMDGQQSTLDAFQRTLMHDPQPAQIHQAMIRIYQDFAVEGAPQYRNALQQIVRGRLPFLYHCTAGKDRTGVFSAILLLTLGVPRDVVQQDYLLSNDYLLTPETMERMKHMMQAVMPDAPPLSPEAMRALMGVDKSYLDAALAAIDARYGSFDRYRHDALGISDAEAKALQNKLLTP